MNHTNAKSFIASLEAKEREEIARKNAAVIEAKAKRLARQMAKKKPKRKPKKKSRIEQAGSVVGGAVRGIVNFFTK